MVTCERLGEHIGTAVTVVDLCALDESEQAAINAALAETGVVVFPRASLSEEGLLQLCEQLGDVRPHPLLAAALANPEFKVSGFSGVAVRPEGLDSRIHRLSPAARNDDWHHDLSPEKVPPAASVLQAVQLPRQRGLGQTRFANMYSAYDTLSVGLRDMLAGLNAMHLEARNPDGGPPTETPHPVVRVHPVTGRRALYAGSFVRRFEVCLTLLRLKRPSSAVRDPPPRCHDANNATKRTRAGVERGGESAAAPVPRGACSTGGANLQPRVGGRRHRHVGCVCLAISTLQGGVALPPSRTLGSGVAFPCVSSESLKRSAAAPWRLAALRPLLRKS
jgi:alpha-ketoglutarate-dependent taurine dioxygenase